MKFLTFTQFLVFSCILATQSAFALTQEKLVLIGGLNEYRIGECSNNQCGDGKPYDQGYLDKYSKLGKSLSSLDNNINSLNREEFYWSGDPVTHGEGVNLKNKFNKWFYEEICNANENCIVSFIAHSWGTIILSDFLQSIPENLNVRTVVTYGSPVTGSQIKWNKDPFWEDAVNSVKNRGGKWFNVVNKQDLIAWKIPGTTNVNPDGSLSNKGRFSQTFPVNNSEFDPSYLLTSAVRGCAFSSCTVLGSRLVNAWTDSGNNINDIPTNMSGWSNYFYNSHFTHNYNPDKIISYIKDNSAKEYSTASESAFALYEKHYPSYFSNSTATREAGMNYYRVYFPSSGKVNILYAYNNKLYYRIDYHAGGGYSYLDDINRF